MKIIKKLIILTILFFHTSLLSSESTFDDWLKNFKIYALKNNISEETFNKTMLNVIFLSKVIEYDRYQPEFYEDTNTYVSKRTSDQKVKKGKDLYLQNKDFINSIDKKFLVEKELLLALMGIETNFGAYVGKMDILSSLATLSFDKRRSAFFTNELITILQLVENDIIDYRTLYGSWAGAFGNFQFMPSTINKYAIDYDGNNIIDLKSIDDSFASAANYINKIGWKKNEPCYYEIELDSSIPLSFLNVSAKKIHNKKKFKYFKKYIIDADSYNIAEDSITAIITPDKDIIPHAYNLKPAYIVFNNYELILKWNRSLRFALAVCTLKDKFKNEL
jgi:membrane-bound lytic murein transglycosylase B